MPSHTMRNTAPVSAAYIAAATTDMRLVLTDHATGVFTHTALATRRDQNFRSIHTPPLLSYNGHSSKSLN
jgi:hypothetical protein